MSTDYIFQGWMGRDPDSINGNMIWQDFKPRPWTEDDVDVKITHCGVCGTDTATLKCGWGNTVYACCVGHEIIGHAVRVGENVQRIKVGDHVGVGAQALSCLQPDCPSCSTGNLQYCQRTFIHTYNSKYPGTENMTYGGFATYHRADSRFVVRIPDGISSEHAAPMMCGGATMYSPLKRHGCGPGKKVGIIGLGGLGHFGIMIAKALGAEEVVVVSRKGAKRKEALQLGADRYIATDDDEDWAQKNAGSVDLVICTVGTKDMPLNEYLGLVKPHAPFVQIGVPEHLDLPPINSYLLMVRGSRLCGSAISSPGEIEEMLQFVVDNNIKPWVQVRSMKDANQAIQDMEQGKALFRYVLVNEIV